MKRVVSAFFFLFIAFHAAGQYGNEWISFGQPYFKIPVGSDGLYRIPYKDLVQAGFPDSADPRTFQLFHRGAEQAILVQGESDGIFDSGDYVEFFGKRNDGTLDSTLYENTAHQPHRYYNLFSDTTSYFLTYGARTGKRISSFSGSSQGLKAETYHRNEKILILKEAYSGGIDYGNVQQTTFDQGEGWMGVQIVQNQEVSYVVPGITETATAAGKPVLEILLTGRGSMVHHADVSTGARFLTSISFPGYESYKHTQAIEWSDIDANGNLTVKIKVSGVAGPDRVSAGYVRVIYPQQITMAGVTERSFLVGPNTANFSFIQIQNAVQGTRLFDVSDPDAVVEIAGTFGGTFDAVFPASTERKIFASSEVKTPQRITCATFRNINPASHNYIIITHPSLRKPSSGYIDPVKAYAEYRALPEGGGFDTLIVNIGQLYDQFNFGERSPRAIFQFLKFLVSVKAPEYLFLIGKGLDVNYGYGRNPSVFTSYKDLVPTAGYPASDMAFTAGLSAIPGVPAVATGRLTAISPSDVAAYFNKVKEREALPFNDLSRKKILHLSGGIEESEPVMFRNILREYASVARGLYLGASVQAIGKQSTDVKLVNVAGEVNSGLGLITFFGHSAPNTTDFDIGMVSDPVMGYDNKGKYPFLLMNGCNAGSFFLNATIFGEDWIKTPDKGAVGFIAHSSYGRLVGLQRYASTFYKVAFGDSVYIRKGAGRVQVEVAKRYVQNFGSAPASITQIQQMVLLGDPAVRVFGAEKPDYAIDEEKISITSFDGQPVTAYSDSFLIRIPVRNFGIADERSIRLEVTRQFNDEPVVTYDSIITGTLYSDTVSFVIRKKDDRGFGINNFSISMDADHFVDELNESNNTAVFEYFIPLNSTRNLYPYNFSIVSTQEVGLSFQYTDLHAAPREYLLEIDTASTFGSGFKKQFRISATVLGKQQVQLLSVDTLVYYWRTKIAEPLESESKDWTVSSFTYIDRGPEGWAQVHFPQFEANTTDGLVMDPVIRRMRYEETVSDVAIKTFSAAAARPLDSVSVKINGVEFNLLNQGGDCRNNTINLIAFDRRSTQPYAGLYFKWYELLYKYGGRRLLCGREPYVINSFKPDELITGNQDDLSQYIDNIFSGDSVVLFSMGDAGFTRWPEQARLELASFGISIAQLDVLQDGDPVIIFGRKGSPPGSATVFHAPAPQPSLQIKRTISGRFSSGTMSSVTIGPAQRWDDLVVKYREVEGVDDFSFSVLGIRQNGIADTLMSNITSSVDLSFINAETYPHVKAVFRSNDDINLTSVQLEKWLVVYEPVADGLVFYRGPTDQQVVQEGQFVSGDFGFINVSEKMFADSLDVRYDLLNYSNPAPSPSIVRIKPPLPGDTTLFTLTFNTVSKDGLNDVEVFVNPRLQKERSYDNNVMVLKEHLNVLTDEMNPVVEITFDGRHLEDNEFVSPEPEIRIRLWDENPFMLKKDTLGVNIFLAFPCESDECAFRRINLSRSDVMWQPASETSDFFIVFSPDNLPDGTYRLRVEAGDASANPGGSEPYEIRFRVQHTPSVTVTPPYPNPFYLQTSFDLMVTGEETSSYFYRLEVTALNGTLVAEYSEHETGFHVGNNSIKWNGTDAAGRSLPDGIYLYRLYIKSDVEERTYHGKMVLLR